MEDIKIAKETQETANGQLEKILNDLQEEMSRLTTKMEEERVKNRTLIQERDQLAVNNKAFAEKESRIGKELNEARSGKEFKRVREELEVVRKERDLLKSLGSASIQKQVDLCTSLDRLEEDNGKLKAEISKLEAQAKAKESETQHQIATLQKNLEESRATPSEKERWWKEEMKALKDENSKLLEVLGTKAQKERDLQSSLLILQDKKQVIDDVETKEKDDLKAKLDQVEKRLFEKEVEFAQESKTLKAKVKRLKAQNTVLTKQIKKMGIDVATGTSLGATSGGKGKTTNSLSELP
eukprot:TRINITY_DN25385_c0_g1_i6.p1 TRINITY_DN25385_c0_g1~~TRINITY_DN25385_c0_g1_i6.p1  ORF type:complete len:318 (+),score=80.40 TRINITY_DN25385_c0_g1_i6:68-955(+)